LSFCVFWYIIPALTTRAAAISLGPAFHQTEGEQNMKQGIHPDYTLSEVHCACGEKYQTRSTKNAIRLDICSVCHPFFTGKQKLIDTEGRVDKFRKKYNKA
jgi:large subunit ribosomal protein L31